MTSTQASAAAHDPIPAGVLTSSPADTLARNARRARLHMGAVVFIALAVLVVLVFALLYSTYFGVRVG